jgi:hypothetical protein
MTEFSNTDVSSSTVTIASLSSIANGGYSAPSNLVDNTTNSGAQKSFLRGYVRLGFSAALTAGTGSPSIVLYLHQARDGSILPTPPGTSAIAPTPNAQQVIVQLTASATFQYIDFPAFDMDAFKYGFQVLNASGVAFSGTATMTLYRGDALGV